MGLFLFHGTSKRLHAFSGPVIKLPLFQNTVMIMVTVTEKKALQPPSRRAYTRRWTMGKQHPVPRPPIHTRAQSLASGRLPTPPCMATPLPLVRLSSRPQMTLRGHARHLRRELAGPGHAWAGAAWTSRTMKASATQLKTCRRHRRRRLPCCSQMRSQSRPRTRVLRMSTDMGMAGMGTPTGR